jgi:hypothetical protein
MPFAFMSNASSIASIGNPTVASPLNMTRYAGALTGIDDGYGTTLIDLPAGMTWYYGVHSTNVNTAFTQFYLCTNGYITFGNGGTGIYSGPHPGIIAANPGDNWVQSGLQNATPTTTVQDFYTRGGSSTYVISGSNDSVGTHYWMDIVCYCGTYGSTTTSRDWQMRLGKYGGTQYIMTRARGNIAGTPGPYGTNGTAYPGTASDINQVWVSTNNGSSWSLLGFGFLSLIGPPMQALSGGSYSLASLVDSLNFRCGSASGTSGYNETVGFPYHNQYGAGRDLGGTNQGGAAYFYGGNYLSMQSWNQTILNYVVGNFGAGDPRYTFLTDTSSGYQAGDINAGGSVDLSDSIAIQNIQVGNSGYIAATDTPVIRMRNLFSLARSSTYYEILSGTYYLAGNITLNDLRPGYQVYATNTYQIANYDNSDGTGVRSRRMYLYSSYINTSPPATASSTVSLSQHIGWAQSVLQVGTGPRGANP